MSRQIRWTIIDDNGIAWVYDGRKLRDPNSDEDMGEDNGYWCDNDNQAIIELMAGGYIDPLQFIHAYNLHNELVEALDEANGAMGEMLLEIGYGGPWITRMEAIRDKARAVLAKAEALNE